MTVPHIAYEPGGLGNQGRCADACHHRIVHETHYRTVTRCRLFYGPTTFGRLGACAKAEADGEVCATSIRESQT